MKLNFSLVVLGFLLLTQSLCAQTISIEEYINTYKDIAMREMIRSGVPASITLAQGIVETENGNSKLVKKSNNHFGIKCKETWTGPTVSHDDDAPGECFRKYGTPEESYIDHSNFLVTRKHYAFLFTLDPADYKSWAYGLKKAGYATNPRYPELLIKYIETYNLNSYSLIALNRKTPVDSNTVAVAKTETVLPPVVSEEKPVVEEQKPIPEKKPVVIEVPKVEKNEIKPIVAVIKPKEEIKQTVTPIVTEPVIEKKPAIDYPSGEFKINETRVVFVGKGTSFLSIAQQYNIPLKWLFDFNDAKETEEAVSEDQLIYLQRKRRTGANEFHIVAVGETLYQIAQEEAIRLEALQQLNLLKPDQQPAAGERLNLQLPATVAPKLKAQTAGVTISAIAASDVVTNEKIIHIVQPKETLYSISRKYEVELTELLIWNQLMGIELKEGMELIVNKK